MFGRGFVGDLKKGFIFPKLEVGLLYSLSFAFDVLYPSDFIIILGVIFIIWCVAKNPFS